MIRSTAGAELCATASNPNARADECVEAFDRTHKGLIPLTSNVVIGDPIQRSPTVWSVPYDVVDEAGNSAETVWRDVHVEEVDIATLEATIRREMQEQMEAEKEEAVRKAAAAERKKKGTAAPSREMSAAKNTCECPPCTADVSTTNEASNEEDRYCESSSKVVQILMWLENFMTPSYAQTSLLIFVLFGTYLVLNVFWSTLLGPPSRRQRDADFDSHSEERARAIQQGIGFLPNNQLSVSKPISDSGSIFEQERSQSTPSSTPRIPRTSVYLNGDNHRDSSLNGTAQSFTSPYQNGHMQTIQPPPSAGSFADDFYNSPSKITPSKRGDGVHRRSPFDSADRGSY